MCPEAVRRTLATMLDVTLLKSPSFMMLAVSGFLCMMGFFVPFLYLTSRANEFKMDHSGFLLPAIGISNTIARIVCGFLSSLENVDALLLSNIAITLGGLTTMLSGILVMPTVQFSYALIFGLAIGKWHHIHFDNCRFSLILMPNFFFICSMLFCATINYCRRFNGHRKADKCFRVSHVVPGFGCRYWYTNSWCIVRCNKKL